MSPVPGPIVMKFGGTSVADADRLVRVSGLARARSASGVLLVLSAMSGVTDALLACAEKAVAGDEAGALKGLDDVVERHRKTAKDLLGEGKASSLDAVFATAREELGALLRGAALLKEMPPRSLDTISGRGELLSTAMLAAYMDIPWIDARSVMRTDSKFGCARPLAADIESLCVSGLRPFVKAGAIAVTQGFIGSDAAGVSTTLGRGGSDYSASIFGAAIDAAEIQIWTDVEGVLTCDPRVVKEAVPVELLGYDEAAELAAFGAKVLHPATILPAVEKGIPVTVRHSMVPDGKFTTISRHSASGRPVTALASRSKVAIITVKTPRMLGGSGYLAKVFDVFGRMEASVDLVATSEIAVSITLSDSAPLAAIEAELRQYGDVTVETGKAVIAMVGERLKTTPGVSGKAFQALGDINVEMISLGANEINLSIVVAAHDAPEAQRRLHAAFFGGGNR